MEKKNSLPKNVDRQAKEKMTVYLPEELAWKMRSIGVERRIGKTDTDYVSAAVSEWVATEGRAHMSEDARDLHKLVDEIVARNRPENITHIKGAMADLLEEDAKSEMEPVAPTPRRIKKTPR